MFRTMNESHEAKLKTMLRLDYSSELPKPVVDWYWAYKQLADRIGSGNLSDEALVIILLQATNVSLPDDPPPTFLDVVAAGMVRAGDQVEIKWQRAQWLGAQYVGVDGDNQIVVLFRNEERQVAPDRVRLPEAASEKAAA